MIGSRYAPLEVTCSIPALQSCDYSSGQSAIGQFSHEYCCSKATHPQQSMDAPSPVNPKTPRNMSTTQWLHEQNMFGKCFFPTQTVCLQTTRLLSQSNREVQTIHVVRWCKVGCHGNTTPHTAPITHSHDVRCQQYRQAP